ncbi:MAG: aspartate--tRNA(Asn) ligase [Candidatus Aenigmatarchaeota archaeon]
MKLTASDIKNEGEFKVYGIVSHVRELGSKKFIIITDGKDILQVVYEGNKRVKRGDSIFAVGNAFFDKRAPRGIELRAKDIEIINEIKEESFDEWSIKRMSLDKKIKYRSVSLRIPEFYKIFEIYAKVTHYFREFFINLGYLEIFTPKVVKMGTESGAEVFSILYFDKEAFLAQSPQLYKQMMLASGLKGVFEFGHYYRAEASRTKRHLTEFYCLDVEINYVESLDDVMKVLEDAIKYVLEKFNLKMGKIPILTFDEAKEILERNGIKTKKDLTTEGEKFIGDYVKENFNSDFVFITEFPFDVKPFYVMKKDDGKSYSFDLLFKGLEIVSGAKREHRYEILINQIKEKKINPERMHWYLETFKHGIPPHGGFGLGIDRFVKQMLNLDDIRECVLYPRDPDTLEP